MGIALEKQLLSEAVVAAAAAEAQVEVDKQVEYKAEATTLEKEKEDTKALIEGEKVRQAQEVQERLKAEQHCADTMLNRLVADIKENIADGHYTRHILDDYKREALSSGSLSTVGASAEIQMLKRVDGSMKY